MRITLFSAAFAIACQTENPKEESTVENEVGPETEEEPSETDPIEDDPIEDDPEGTEDPSELLRLPDLLECASANVHYDYTGSPLTVRFGIRNIYGQAEVSFTMGALHSNVEHQSMGSGQAQVQPTLSADSIQIFIPDGTANGQSSGTVGEGLLGGNTFIVLYPEEEGHYSGMLQSFAFFDLPVSCWAPETPRQFNYDGETGRCESANGDEGFNPADPIKVRETGDAHCMDLRGWDLAGHHFPAHPWFSSEANLVWDLSGSLLDEAFLYNANLIDADFSGADMGGLDHQNSRVLGIIDDYTTLPEDCEADGLEIDCSK